MHPTQTSEQNEYCSTQERVPRIDGPTGLREGVRSTPRASRSAPSDSEVADITPQPLVIRTAPRRAELLPPRHQMKKQGHSDSMTSSNRDASDAHRRPLALDKTLSRNDGAARRPTDSAAARRRSSKSSGVQKMAEHMVASVEGRDESRRPSDRRKLDIGDILKTSLMR